MGRTLAANKLLAGSACGKRQRGRPLNSVVRATIENTNDQQRFDDDIEKNFGAAVHDHDI